MVNVIGLGYIGLPTALMLASSGVCVVGTDCSNELISKLKSGVITFEEAGLDKLFDNACKMGIEFTSEYVSTDLYIIAVPTPYDKTSKRIDASYLVSAVKMTVDVCLDNSILVIESTISPGTIDKHIRPIIHEAKLKTGKNINVAHAPERITPGNMIYELEHNSRTIGVDDNQTGCKLKGIYSAFCKGEIILTDIRTAEMTKVVENAYRDVNIAFANELAKICRSDNMDVYEIIRIANMHPRVNILSPGPGVGGHCISVDPWFLVGDYPGLANLILTARKINDSMPEFVLERMHQIMVENNVNDVSSVGLYGLTYKENVDDVRESPTLQLINNMKRHLAFGSIKVYDPYVKQNIVENQYHDFESFLSDVDMIVILVGHDEIKNNQNKLKGKIILDTRNVCNLDGIYKL